MLTCERLLEVLFYNKLTGIFRWRISPSNNVTAGDIAGYKNKKGYIIIKIDNKNYQAHRLAWLYEKGYFPEYGLDHKDRIPWHNWILNLREVSQSCNMRNTGNRKDNISGVKGVSWNKQKNKWWARIRVGGIDKFLGSYNSFDNAVCARFMAEQCLEWGNCDSLSPACRYVKTRVIDML